MTIAINCRLNNAEQPEGYAGLLFGILDQLTAKFHEHAFIFIFDKPYPADIFFAKNVTPIITGPETRSTLRLQYWLNYKIPAVLRKHKATVFVSLEGTCSMRTKIPQCLVMAGCSFMQPRLMQNPQARFYKKHSAGFLAKAKSIATFSTYARELIAGQYKMPESAITVLNPAVDNIFQPMEWDEKEHIKEKYTEGRAYFIYSGDINQHSNTISLLKAFTFFKTRQKSNMRLLIAGNAPVSFKKELSTYKFRNDVLLLEGLPLAELAKITAAAYALVHPVLYSDLAIGPLQAMRCGIPMIVANTGALPAICGQAAIYCNTDIKSIAESMMLVFKDEDEAARLVREGNDLLQQYTYARSAGLLMQCILQCAD